MHRCYHIDKELRKPPMVEAVKSLDNPSQPPEPPSPSFLPPPQLFIVSHRDGSPKLFTGAAAAEFNATDRAGVNSKGIICDYYY